jgi:hypothetical protein
MNEVISFSQRCERVIDKELGNIIAKITLLLP